MRNPLHPMLHLFASSCFQLQVLVLGVVHLVIPRVPSDVMEHVQREREVEAFFIGQSGRGKICLLSVFTAQGQSVFYGDSIFESRCDMLLFFLLLIEHPN